MLTAVMLSMSMIAAVFVRADDNLDTPDIEIVEPAYVYIESAKSELTISSSTGYCNSKLSGNSRELSFQATQYLEKKVLWWWDSVAEWNQTTYGTTLTMTNSKSSLGSGTYRLRTEFTVYSGSNSEPVQKISSEKSI